MTAWRTAGLNEANGDKANGNKANGNEAKLSIYQNYCNLPIIEDRNVADRLVVSATDYKPRGCGFESHIGMVVYLCLSYCVLALRRGGPFLLLTHTSHSVGFWDFLGSKDGTKRALFYINYSNIAAKLVRQALKPEFRADAAKRGDSHLKVTKWADGKPIRAPQSV
ncbi:unnamed protein product [Brassicogethes aeneus]|uniref:Uncharacterized protein n=1 Tax=Brassicogethes aeneus TaxID=1431903 RepID=A0A9P0APA9_BRAAE|nr:unnamed protein product [Brassicogethes aeneus]